MNPMDDMPWEGAGDSPWENSAESWEPDDAETWRGDIHINDWPESLAGPEYWLNKQENDDE